MPRVPSYRCPEEDAGDFQVPSYLRKTPRTVKYKATWRKMLRTARY
jgi:hypothetical protein